MFSFIIVLLFSTAIQSCTVSIIWDSTYTNGFDQNNELISPPNSDLCDFHLGWRVILNVTTLGRFENLWQVRESKEFEDCDPTNAVESRSFTGVYEFSLSPGIFFFDSVYYFFSTSNGSLSSAEEKRILTNCSLKLSFKLKPSSSNCTLKPECYTNSLSTATTTTNTTINTMTTRTGNSTLNKSNTSLTLIPITEFLLTDIQLLIFVLTGFIIVFVLSICFIVMLYFAFVRGKRHTEEVAVEFEVDPDFETYFRRFLTLEKEFSNQQQDFQLQSLPNLQSNSVQNFQLQSLPNLFLRNSEFALGVLDSSIISENSIHRTKSISLV